MRVLPANKTHLERSTACCECLECINSFLFVMLWEERLGMLLLVPISALIMCTLVVAEEVRKPGVVPLFQPIEASKGNDSSSDVTYGRIILEHSRTTEDGDYITQNGERLHGKTPDVAEYDYQSDFDWRHLEKLQEEASSSFGPRGPAVESLLQMKPMVECGADIMTLRVKGGSLLYLLVDRGEASPLPLSNLPPQCGYSLRTTWRDTVFMAPYDGCYGVKEGDNYVLPLRWGGTPLKMTCPARPHVATSPSVSCHPSGMVVTIPGSGDASKLMIMYKGAWNPLLWVSVQCGYSVVTHSGGLVVTAPFATCGEIKDGMYTLEFMEGKVKLSCPSQPLTGSPSVSPPPSPKPSQTTVSYLKLAIMTPSEPYFTPPPQTVTPASAPVTFKLQRPVSWHLMVPRPHLPTHAPVPPKPVTHTVYKPLPTRPVPPSHKHPTPPAAHPHVPHLWNTNNPLIPVYPPFPFPPKSALKTPAPVIPKLAPPFPGLPTPVVPKLAPPFPGLPHTPHKIPWHFNLFQTPVPSHPHFYPRPPKPTPQIPIFLRPPPQMTPHPLSDPLYTPIPKPVAHHPVHGSPAHPHHTDLFYPSLPKPPVLPPVVPPPVRPVGPAVPCIFPPCPWLPVFHNHMYFNLGSHFIDCAQTHPGKPSTFPNFMLPYHSRHHNLQESSVSPRRHYDNHGPASQPFHSWDLVVPFSKPSSHMETKHKGSPPQPYNPSFYWNPAHPKPPELKQTSYPQNSEPVLDEHSGSRSAATSLSVSLGSR
ncbi:uncharacterized protein [Paramormyrops kingsleyae]|uniref:uncharacterized protein n=1 Tax=Paramormyrops kingsleyae TaxID=1676925 RepID=UPI003B971905